MKYLLYLTLMFSMCVSVAMEKTSGTNIPDKQSVRVLGTGKTLEEAKMNGFQKAVQQVAGTVVVSEQEFKDNFLERNQVATYSAGYVDDFKIIEKHEGWYGYQLIMDVLVKSSKISQQILNNQRGEANLQGETMAAQWKTFIAERNSGDNFIKATLSSYPKNSFNIKVGDIQYKVDSYRNSILIVPYEISFKYEWIVALKEFLKVMADGDSNSPVNINVISKKPGAWVGSRETYYFNDIVRFEKIREYLDIMTLLQVKILDRNGEMIYSQCTKQPMISINNINSNKEFISQAEIMISPDSSISKKLERMSKVEVNLIKVPEFGWVQNKHPECNTN